MSETKAPHLAESRKNIEKIEHAIDGDSKKFGTKARFGYFSIPYSSFMGDKYYSQERQKIYRTEDRNVITEVRGIFTKPLKKGKAPDAYFSNGFKEEKATLKRVKEMAEKDREEYLAMVRKNKENDPNKVYRAKFKPSGPAEYKNLYDINPVRYKIPITKEIDKKTKIDKEHRTVFIEKRGVMTNPSKFGTSSTPGVLFSYFKEDKKLLERKKMIAEDEKLKKRSKSAKEEGGDYKKAFRPAALKKNECFQNDKQLYGEDDKKVKSLLVETIEVILYYIILY